VHRYTRKRASFPAVFLYGTGTPRSWLEVREQELVHRFIRGVSFQQNFAKFRIGSRSAASHRRALQFIRSKLDLYASSRAIKLNTGILACKAN
jgi:hypothetical protein